MKLKTPSPAKTRLFRHTFLTNDTTSFCVREDEEREAIVPFFKSQCTSVYIHPAKYFILFSFGRKNDQFGRCYVSNINCPSNPKDLIFFRRGEGEGGGGCQRRETGIECLEEFRLHFFGILPEWPAAKSINF